MFPAPLLSRCTISDNCPTIPLHVPFACCKSIQVICQIYDLQFFTLRCYLIIWHGYHKILGVFSYTFRDVCLDDFFELWIILCIDHQIQWLNLLFVLSIEKSHLQLLVFVITWYWSLCSAFHVKQLHIHFAIVDVIVGESVFSEESITSNKQISVILPLKARMERLDLSSQYLNTVFSDLSKACFCFLLNWWPFHSYSRYRSFLVFDPVYMNFRSPTEFTVRLQFVFYF